MHLCLTPECGEVAEYELKEGRALWIQVVLGELSVEDREGAFSLKEGDGLAIESADTLVLRALEHWRERTDLRDSGARFLGLVRHTLAWADKFQEHRQHRDVADKRGGDNRDARECHGLNR